MITIRHERLADLVAREQLLHAAYGPARFTKASERLREGRAPAEGLAFVATEDGRAVGTVRLWHVTAGHDRPALLLGPLAVAAECRHRGIGSALVARALREAKRKKHRAVLLVGDREFYGRFGFSAERTGGLWLSGPNEAHRLLACELAPGALDGASGLIAASRPQARARLSALVGRAGREAAAAAQPA